MHDPQLVETGQHWRGALVAPEVHIGRFDRGLRKKESPGSFPSSKERPPSDEVVLDHDEDAGNLDSRTLASSRGGGLREQRASHVYFYSNISHPLPTMTMRAKLELCAKEHQLPRP